MGDMADRLREQGGRRAEACVALDVAPADTGAQAHAVGTDVDAVEPGDLAQVDEQRRCGEPEGEHRHQALPPGERARFALAPGEQFKRLREGVRRRIVELGWFHEQPPACCGEDRLTPA